MDINLKNKRGEFSNGESNKRMKPGSNNKGSSRRFPYMFMVISLSFILSYIPQIFLLFSMFRDPYFWIKSSHVETIVYKFLDQMVMINNIVNPFVYGFFNKKFRSAAKTLICKFCRQINALCFYVCLFVYVWDKIWTSRRTFKYLEYNESQNYIAYDVFLVYLMAGLTGNIAVLAIHKTILQD